MNPKSASALVWFSALLILIGFVALDPGLRFVLFVLAAVCAAIPAVIGRERPRIIGVVALIAAALLAADAYPTSSSRLEAYVQHSSVAHRVEHAAEGGTLGKLGMLRSARTSYAIANKGASPADLNALSAGGKYLPEPPVLWLGNDGARVNVPHEPTTEYAYYPTRSLKDSGKWAFVNGRDDKDYGEIYIDCTHTDTKGTQWSSY